MTTTATPAEAHSSDLHPIEASALHARRERVFLILAGLFLGSMTMLNILGVTRFLDLSFTVFGLRVPMPLAVGVLPYPLTFLCTDFISEIYGRKRANFLVWVGFLVNLWLSQFVDSFSVITITHFAAAAIPVETGEPIWPQLWVFIGTAYVFKFLAAAVDTLPFYLGTRWLRRYLEIEEGEDLRQRAMD